MVHSTNRRSHRVPGHGLRPWLGGGGQQILPDSVLSPTVEAARDVAAAPSPQGLPTLSSAGPSLVARPDDEQTLLLAFGADRALLAWITTLTHDTGFVTFSNLTDFFDAFQLARSGVQYQRFEQRLQRLLSRSLTLVLKTPTGIVRLNMRPLQKAYTPRDGSEARRLLAAENRSPQLSLLPSDLKRYGLVLDPAFHEYLRANPVVLPLPIMRRFHSRPLFWDAASYLLYRCWSARAKSRITWHLVRRQLASVDQHDRRLAQSLNRVAQEIRRDYSDFPAYVEVGSHDRIVAPFRPPEKHSSAAPSTSSLVLA